MMMQSQRGTMRAVVVTRGSRFASQLKPSVETRDLKQLTADTKAKVSTDLLLFMREGKLSPRFFLDVVTYKRKAQSSKEPKSADPPTPFVVIFNELPDRVNRFLKLGDAVHKQLNSNEQDDRIVNDFKQDLHQLHDKLPGSISHFLRDTSVAAVRKKNELSYITYGNLLAILGEWETAKQSYGKAFSLNVAKHGLGDLKNVHLLRAAGFCDSLNNNHQGSLDVRRKCLELSLEQLHGWETVYDIWLDIAESQEHLGQSEAAQESRTQAESIKESKISSDLKLADPALIQELLDKPEPFNVAKVCKTDKKAWAKGGQEYLKEASKPHPFLAFTDRSKNTVRTKWKARNDSKQ